MEYVIFHIITGVILAFYLLTSFLYRVTRRYKRNITEHICPNDVLLREFDEGVIVIFTALLVLGPLNIILVLKDWDILFIFKLNVITLQKEVMINEKT